MAPKFCCRTHTINPRFAHLIIPSSPPSNSKNSFLEGKRARHERERRRSLNNSFLSLCPRDLRSLPLSCTPPPPPSARLLLPPTRRKSIAEIQVHTTPDEVRPRSHFYIRSPSSRSSPPRPALKTRNPERARTRISRAH
jgi:hypothetical protein